MNAIVVTNRLSSATVLVVDGTPHTIAGSGTLTIDEGALIRLKADPIQAQRFQPAGDLSASSPPASGGAAQSFSTTVDATTPGTTELVPAVPGRSWQTSKTRFAVASSSGSPTAAEIGVRRGSDLWQGVSADASFVPLTSFSGMATAAGDGLSVSVDVAAAGGALAVSVEVHGSYV